MSAYHKGYNDFERGLRRNENPYVRTSMDWMAWFRGWDKAYKENLVG